MFASRRGRTLAGALAAGVVLTLAACSSGGALDSGSTSSSSSKTIIIGSAAFPENAIIADIYAQALQAKGVKVSTTLNIGQRPAYLAALKDGSIDLIPEYSGNLLQYYDPKTTAQSSSEVLAALKSALPKGFEVLNQSAAEDKDSYSVTKAFSEQYNVKSLADLAAVKVPLTIAADPEFATRPYGPPGLKSAYGVASATVVPFSDGGGALTQAALKNNQANLADIYTTNPGKEDFVTLSDPKNLIIAQNVLPLINTKFASSTVTSVLNEISAKLTTADLIKLNTLNQGPQKAEPAALAKQWLSENKIK
jgi:osmoprotectant transport system substrate-binding protein